MEELTVGEYRQRAERTITEIRALIEKTRARAQTADPDRRYSYEMEADSLNEKLVALENLLAELKRSDNSPEDTAPPRMGMHSAIKEIETAARKTADMLS